MNNETITIPRKLAEDILCQMQTSEISPNTLFLLMQIMLNNKRDTPEVDSPIYASLADSTIITESTIEITTEFKDEPPFVRVPQGSVQVQPYLFGIYVRTAEAMKNHIKEENMKAVMNCGGPVFAGKNGLAYIDGYEIHVEAGYGGKCNMVYWKKSDD